MLTRLFIATEFSLMHMLINLSTLIESDIIFIENNIFSKCNLLLYSVRLMVTLTTNNIILTFLNQVLYI